MADHSFFSSSTMQCSSLEACLAVLFTHAEILSNVESVATVLALLVGGWWTYTRFIRGRHHYPRAELTHEVLDRALGSGKRLLQVRLEIKNIGGTLLQVSQVDARVQLVSPLGDAEVRHQSSVAPPLAEAAPANIPWPLVARRLTSHKPGALEVEPGEADWIEFDFVLDDPLEVVRVYTYIANAAKVGRSRRAIGWRQASYYEIGAHAPTMRTSAVQNEEEQSGPEDLPPSPKRSPGRRPALPERKQGPPEDLPPAPPRPVEPARTPARPNPQGEPERLPDSRPSTRP